MHEGRIKYKRMIHKREGWFREGERKEEMIARIKMRKVYRFPSKGVRSYRDRLSRRAGAKSWAGCYRITFALFLRRSIMVAALYTFVNDTCFTYRSFIVSF